MKTSKLLLTLVIGFLLIGLNANAEMLQIKGSDTMINLVQRLSEAYMEANPGKYIAATGGGSGTGVAALMNKKCDIANASRAMKASEIEQANTKGVSPQRVVIAIDGLSVIVNSGNSVDKLTVDEIGKIYRGEIKNWNELGGSNMPISLYGRQSNSGTFGFFRDEVVKGDYSANMKAMNGNSQIVEAVKSDPSAIGYVGVGYAKETSGISVLKVAAKVGDEYYSPLDSEDVKSGLYPISRPLNQYVNGAPKGDVADFIKFELSYEGQQLVEEMDFFPVSKEYQEFNAKLGL